ncbi:MAG: outer membrane lipoprotein carrier protein LolA [Hylemonella sp.]|uniref:outer membrane lipoprotein carrier protein LolA n=1 Tax=Hylemonella sp. TaxID=2066020 RepID=UPI003918B428
MPVHPTEAPLRRVLLLALLLTGLPAAHAADWQLADLMQQLSQVRNAQARFVERKYIALLDKPVESSGELSFTAPDRMEMRTLRPKRQSLLLDGNRLTMEHDGRTRTVSLQSYPEVAAFVEGIRGTLAGDRQALERVYQVHLIGSAARWQLLLVPREATMSRIISRIRIGGSQGEVLSVAYDHADGDRSEMQITPLRP